MLPISMLGGILFYQWMEYITFISPYLIFLMLFITYCKLTPTDIKPDKFEWTLLGVQMLLTAIGYALTFFWNRTLSEGVFICFFIPTATAAPVITAMLGGSISKVATYVISKKWKNAISVYGCLHLPHRRYPHIFHIILYRKFRAIFCMFSVCLCVYVF